MNTSRILTVALLLSIGASVDAMQRARAQVRTLGKLAQAYRLSLMQHRAHINRLGKFTTLGMGITAGNGPSGEAAAASADWHDKNDTCSESWSQNMEIQTEVFRENMQEIENTVAEIASTPANDSSSSSESSSSSSDSSASSSSSDNK